MTPGDGGPTPANLTRYAAAVAMADDPSGLMDAATAAFREMTDLSAVGDHRGVARMAAVVGDGCLRLCAAPAATLVQAENTVRFLAIIVGWAWSRHPALAAVLEAARAAESAAWDVRAN